MRIQRHEFSNLRRHKIQASSAKGLRCNRITILGKTPPGWTIYFEIISYILKSLLIEYEKDHVPEYHLSRLQAITESLHMQNTYMADLQE